MIGTPISAYRSMGGLVFWMELVQHLIA